MDDDSSGDANCRNFICYLRFGAYLRCILFSRGHAFLRL